MSNKTIQPTERQKAQLATLQKNFGLSDSDRDRCLYFSAEQENPWIPTDLLISIARMTKKFSVIEPEFSTLVAPLNQLIYKGTVIDNDGRSVTRIGVATLGEKPGGYEIDTHKLAEGRALSAALTDSGFNPFKTNFVIGIIGVEIGRGTERRVPFEAPPTAAQIEEWKFLEDASALRTKDLKQIHAEATRKNLIVGKDMTRYRGWLEEEFGVRTAAGFDEEKRAQVINKLNLLPEYDGEDFTFLPVDLQGDALIA